MTHAVGAEAAVRAVALSVGQIRSPSPAVASDAVPCCSALG